MSVEPETPRFYALLYHFRDAGCCATCAPYWAIKAVEAEFKRDSDSVPPPHCLAPKLGCNVRMRASWKTRPRPEQPAQGRAAA